MPRAAGIFAQDLIQVARALEGAARPALRLLQGRLPDLPDRVERQRAAVGTVTADRKRSDGEWSERFGVLYQPTPTMTYYFSYGTSFNTSGDTYAYDLPGSNTPPESSRNIELGAKLDLFDGPAEHALLDLQHHQVPRAQPRLARRHAARGLPAVGQAPRHRPGHRHRRAHHAAVGHLRVLYLDPERRDRRRQCRRHDHLGRTGRPAPVADAAQQRLDLDHLPGAAAAAPGRAASPGAARRRRTATRRASWRRASSPAT